MSATPLHKLWHNPKWMQWLSRILVALALLAVVAVALQWVTHRPLFSIQVIQLAAAVPAVTSAANTTDATLRHVNVATARAAALPKILNTTHLNFFTVNLETIRQAFENVAWVRHAEVSRVWPNRLLVEIEEHQLLGTWNNQNDDNASGNGLNYAFVNTHGEVFAVNPDEAEDETSEELPEFSGPQGSEKLVVTKYRELTEALQTLHLRPDQVSLSSRYAWSLHAYRIDGTDLKHDAAAVANQVADKGLEIEMGREIEPNILARRVTRLVTTYPLITALWPKPTLIDLRYPNGFALRAEGLKLVSESGPGAPKAAPKSQIKSLTSSHKPV